MGVGTVRFVLESDEGQSPAGPSLASSPAQASPLTRDDTLTSEAVYIASCLHTSRSPVPRAQVFSKPLVLS